MEHYLFLNNLLLIAFGKQKRLPKEVFNFWQILPANKKKKLKLFGLHVKSIRIKQGYTQVDVSSARGKDQQSLQRVESGNINPSLYYLLELAEALEISPKEFFDF